MQFGAIAKDYVKRASYWAEYLSWFLLSPAKFVKKPKNARKVLIVNQGALGDSFVSLRAAHNIKTSNKNVDICLLVDEKSYEPVKEIAKELDIEVIQGRDLRNTRFDLTLLFSYFKYIRECRKNLGFVVGNEYHGLGGSVRAMFDYFINRKNPPLWRHKMRQEIEICRRAGFKIPEKLVSYKVEENKRTKNLLDKKTIGKFAIIQPAGRNFSKLMKAGKNPALAWPLERFAAIADYLIENHGLDIIVTGAGDEKFIGDKVIDLMKNPKRAFNFSGMVSIHELASLVSSAKAVVSVDTGIVHIAEFTGTPIVALFGPTFYEEVGAYGNPEIQANIRHPEECIRDRKKGASHDKENRGMCSISIEEVKKAVDRIVE
jgi:ADP-heptose:LPS heptosyltransferase